MSTEDVGDLLDVVPDAICPGCGERQGWLAKPGEDEFWCNDCLKTPITALLDELNKTRAQRPAMISAEATMTGTVFDRTVTSWRSFENTPPL